MSSTANVRIKSVLTRPKSLTKQKIEQVRTFNWLIAAT